MKEDISRAQSNVLGLTDGIADTVLEHIDEGYLLVDGTGTVVAANAAARSILPADDLAGTAVAQLPAAIVDVLDGASADDGAEAVVAIPTGGSRTAAEPDASGRMDRSQVAIEAEVVPIERDGEWLVLLRHLAGEARSRHFRAVLESSGDGVYSLDSDGRCTYANRAIADLLGYDAEVLVGMHVSEVVGTDDLDRIASVIGDLLDDETAREAVIEHDLITSDGERIPVENHVSLLDDGTFQGTAGFVRDVRDRRDREEQLERYERTIQAMGDGVYVLDEDGHYLAVNDYVVELTGYDRDDLLGSYVGISYDEDDQAAFERAIRGLVAGGTDDVRTVEATLETAAGAEVPVEVTLTVLTSPDGDFRGSVGVVRDITERRERIQELERYETLIEIMPDTVVVTDTDGYIQDLHGFEGWSGYDEAELIGEHLSKTATEADIERAEALIGELIRDDDREKVTYEMDVVTKRDDRIPHENHLALLPPDEDERIPGSISVLRDISDRKAREQALEALNTATRELLTAESVDDVVDKAVATASEVLDLPLTGVFLLDAEEDALVPISYPDADVLPDEPPTFRPGTSVAWDAFEAGETRVYDELQDHDAVHNPETAIQSEIVVPLGDHGVLMSGSTEPHVFDQERQNLVGVLGGAIGTALDRLERDQERDAQRRELRRKNERLERFASVVSHDLRNPLNVANARVNLALESGDVEPLEGADGALSRMGSLIEDLLALAREGESIGTLESVPLDEVATDAWNGVESADASLSVETDHTVDADRARLRELLENLFRNAVEHAGPAVDVRVGPLDGCDGFVVEDDGPGIDPNARDTVFEHGVTGAENGTGLGLAIVEEIAEAHGWTVRATEGAAGGARFEFDTVGSADGD